MTTINLKDFYPWYTHDEYIEVSEEVADELRASRLSEAAYQRRIVRNKAQYSLDCEDGIEYSACISEPTPQELLERMELFCHLCVALNSLPETQGRRVDACVILGKSYREVAEAEGVKTVGFLPRTSGVWWQSSMRSLTSVGWRRPSSTLRTAPTDLGTSCPKVEQGKRAAPTKVPPSFVSPRDTGNFVGCCFSFR